MSTMNSKFVVVYAKNDSKKRKLFADGTLSVLRKDNKTSGLVQGTLLLHNEDGKLVFKSNVTASQLGACFESSEIVCSGYMIQLESEIVNENQEEKGNVAPHPDKNPTFNGSAINNGPSMKPFRLQHSTNGNFKSVAPRPVVKPGTDDGRGPESDLQHTVPESGSTTPREINCNHKFTDRKIGVEPLEPKKYPVVLDASLEKMMRPHQVSGAKFLINRLNGGELVNFSEYEGNIRNKRSLSPQNRSPIPGTASNEFECLLQNRDSQTITGAILADEMGLGKTLMSLAIMWSFLRSGCGSNKKAIIVTPASLVENWRNEIKKWFGVKLKPLCVVSNKKLQGISTIKKVAKKRKKDVVSSDEESENNPCETSLGVTAITTEAESTISAFRYGHAAMSPVLVISYEIFRKYYELLSPIPVEILICDEGHRLKNIFGTKTQHALMQCRVKRKLLLTGTPIQNDLEELYSLHAFVNPGYLGNVTEFRTNYIDPIMKWKDIGAQSGGGAADTQENQCSRDVSSKGIKAQAELSSLLEKVMLQRTQHEVLNRLLPPRYDYVILCLMTAGQKDKYNAICDGMGVEQAVPSVNIDVNIDDETLEPVLETECVGVLGELQKLRKICNKVDSDGDAATTVHGTSLKLELLDAFLETLCTSDMNTDISQPGPSANGAMEKTVIASNFTYMLDAVGALIQSRGYGTCLRIDGGVAVDKRQGIVDRFNRQSDQNRFFLLSSKAGGVGLNLIGANRLILLDCDWNPAIDRQTMARIWREGQTRPVYIYRFICCGTIEQSIFQRQMSKQDLAFMVPTKEQSIQRLSLNRVELEALIRPVPNAIADVLQSCSGGGGDMEGDVPSNITGESETSISKENVENLIDPMLTKVMNKDNVKGLIYKWLQL